MQFTFRVDQNHTLFSAERPYLLLASLLSTQNEKTATWAVFSGRVEEEGSEPNLQVADLQAFGGAENIALTFLHTGIFWTLWILWKVEKSAQILIRCFRCSYSWLQSIALPLFVYELRLEP